MSCTCNKSKNCEPCAFCSPPGVTCLTTCAPIDPCPVKYDLCCVLYSGETHECSDITKGDPLCDIILQILSTLFPPSYCCALTGELTVISVDTDSLVVNITITSSGPDLGPYSILLVDNLGNITTPITGVPKSSLFSPGYTFTISDNTVSVRLQSVNADCPYTEFFLPPPPPPDPACFYILSGNGYNVTWTDANDVVHTEPYIGSSPVYCARVGSIICDDPDAMILGGTFSCLNNICDSIPSCTCTTVINVSSNPTTVNWLTCEGLFQKNYPLPGNATLEICGSLVNSPGLVNFITTSNECVLDDEDVYVCPTTTTTTVAPTTTTTTIPPCNCFSIDAEESGFPVNYINCSGVGASFFTKGGFTNNICAISVATSPNYNITNNGPCTTGSLCIPSAVVPTCTPLYYSKGTLYAYDVATDLVTSLFVPGVTGTTLNYSDVAHTANKMWFVTTSTFIEFNITLNPWSAVFSQNISWPSGFVSSPGLHAINDTTLLVVNGATTTSVVGELNTVTGVFTPKFNLPTGRYVTGDFILTTTNKFIVLTTDGDGDNYINQYDYIAATGVSEFEKQLNPTISLPYALFESGSLVYVMDGFTGVYTIGTSSPNTITSIGHPTNVNPAIMVLGASQIASCITEDFTENSFPCDCIYMTYFGESTSEPVTYIDCNGVESDPIVFDVENRTFYTCGSDPQTLDSDITFNIGTACIEGNCQCINYEVSGPEGDVIVWRDCNGNFQSGLFNSKLPNYCALQGSIEFPGGIITPIGSCAP